MIEGQLKKLEELFDGTDPTQLEEIKKWRKSLKTATMKQNFKKNAMMKIIIEELYRRIELCKKILLTDRGENRDPIEEKVYKTRVYERMDNMKWFLGLFGDNKDITDIKNKIRETLEKNKEFLE